MDVKVSETAKRLFRHTSTIYREIKQEIIDEFNKKKTYIENFSAAYIKKIQDWMNNIL